MVPYPVPRDSPSRLADDQHDFAFVVQLLGLRGAENRFPLAHQGLAGAEKDAGVFRLALVFPVLRVAVAVIDADTDDFLWIRHGGQVANVFQRQVCIASGDDRFEFGRVGRPASVLQPTAQRAPAVPQTPPQVHHAIALHRAEAGAVRCLEAYEPHQAAPAGSNPARSSTPSRRRSSSAVAGIMGGRCSLLARSPIRRIMYLMGIGLVS